MRGQSGIEFLIVFGMIFMILVPIWFFVQVKSAESNAVVRASQAQLAVQKIAEAAETVYVQGPPAKMRSWVVFPEQVQESHVYPNEVSLTFASLGGNSDVFWQTSANLSGSLPTTPGTHAITAEATGSGVALGWG